MPPKPLFDPQQFPQETVLDLEDLRAINPQRFEMEQLTAVTLLDETRRLIVGYKDVSHEEFWIRGHMPKFPLMPGVMMCEAGAQLCSVYCIKAGLLGGDFIGFGGMDDVRFRGVVRPGDRLWLIGKTDRHHTRRMVFHIQGFVGDKLIFHGDFVGVPMHQPGDEEPSLET